MVQIVLSVSEEMNKWICDAGGYGRGDRQRFILANLNMIKNGFIIKGSEIRQVKASDLRQNIDVLRAEAEARARKGDSLDTEGRTSLFVTTANIIDELKSLPRFQQISEETRDTIRILKEESEKISKAFPLAPQHSSIPSSVTPPPPPPPKDDEDG